MQHSLFAIQIIFLLLVTCQSLSLSSVDFKQSVIITQIRPHLNVIGLSMYLPQWLPLLNNSLFQGYTSNSALFQNYANIFTQNIHNPPKYKYNCSSSQYINSSINCNYDLTYNLSISITMQNYFQSVCQSRGIILGWGTEGYNFNNSNYLNNFTQFISAFHRNNISVQLVDYGNQLSVVSNYTIRDYLQDLNILKYLFRDRLRVMGPGITENADSSWIDQLDYISDNYNTVFTFRCLIFHNKSEATINNLMSDNYSRNYLLNRIAFSNGTLIDMNRYNIGINQIRLTNDSGMDQVTNSFAAALWALDVSVQFSSMGGTFINFYNPSFSSNQSIIPSTSIEAPGALYYGLLFTIYALRDSPIFEFPIIESGSSKNIKIFGFRLEIGYRILIINKDIKPNITGTVQIVSSYTNGFRCMYLSANNLSSTTDITIGGMSFIPNSSLPVGNFSLYDYFMDKNTGLYSINISTAQAAVCNAILNPSDYYFPRGANASNSLYCSLVLLIIFFLTFG